MQPIQPAQRVERPPPPASPDFNIDSPDDEEDEESETSTESSYVMSQQFQTLPWPSPTVPRSGRESPIPLARGMSPASSGQRLNTPESSLTAWSGAFVTHNISGAAGAAGGGGGGGTAGQGLVGASWTSATRDMATFDLLRATSGRAGSRDGLSSGGSSRLRNARVPSANAALTEANIDFLRRVPCAAANAGGGSSGRRVARAAQQNSGRPPKPHQASSSPPLAVAAAAAGATDGGGVSSRHTPRGHVAAAVSTLNARWTKDAPAEAHQGVVPVSPVRFRGRGAGVIGATTAMENSISELGEEEETVVTTDAEPPASPSPADAGHVMAPHTREGEVTAEADARKAKGQAYTELRRSPREVKKDEASPVSVTNANASAQSKASPQTADEMVGAVQATSRATESQLQLGFSHQQAQVLARDENTAGRSNSGASTQASATPPLPRIPSPAAKTTKKRATTSGRRQTVGTVRGADTVSNDGGLHPTTAAGLNSVTTSAAKAELDPNHLNGAPAPAKRAATATSKAVPAPPSQYISGGRLVQAARRIPVVAPVDAPHPKAKERHTSAAADEEKAKPNPTRNRPASAAARANMAEQADEKATGRTPSSTNARDGKPSHVLSRSQTLAPTDADAFGAPDLPSLASCSVRTIPPEKARQLRVTQSPPSHPAAESTGLHRNPDNNTTHAPPTQPDPRDHGDAAPTEAEDATVRRTAHDADSKSDGRITPLLTVEVARLTTGPPSRTSKTVPRTSPSSTTAATAKATVPPQLSSHTPDAPAPLTLAKEPPSQAPDATSSPSAGRHATPNQPAAAMARSASSVQGSEGSETGPSTPTRSSRRSGASGQRSAAGRAAARHNIAASRSLNNTSCEWNVGASMECPTSVASTQAPLSTRVPANRRSSSPSSPGHGERERSFSSTLSASAGNSAMDSPAHPTGSGTTATNTASTTTSNTPAMRHKVRPPQPTFSLDGPSLAPRCEATSDATAPPQLRVLHPIAPSQAIVAATIIAGMPQLVSPPASTPPNPALRARRSTQAVNSSAERLRLSDRRGSVPLQAERRRSTNGSASPVDKDVASRRGKPHTTATTATAAAAATHGSPAGCTVPALAATSPGPTTMVVGGRQLPRMFPSPAEGVSSALKPSEKAGATATTTIMDNNGVEDDEDDADGKSASFLANRRRAHSLPAGALTHGNAGSAKPTGGDSGGGTRRTRPIGHGFNVDRSTEAERGIARGTPERPESHLFSPSQDGEGQRGGNAVPEGGNTKAKDGAGAMRLNSLTSPGGQMESGDAAFHASALRLPALTRFPRTPIVATVPDTAPSALPGHVRSANATDDVRQESSGSGNAQTSMTGSRRRPSSHTRDDGASTVMDSNASSLNNRTDAAQSEGSGDGDASERVSGVRSSSRKAAPPRQRAPSVFFV